MTCRNEPPDEQGRYSYGPGETLGFLFSPDEDKRIHSFIADATPTYHHDWTRYEVSRVLAYATADKRMLAALKLIGYDTIGVHKIDGIEAFCKL